MHGELTDLIHDELTSCMVSFKGRATVAVCVAHVFVLVSHMCAPGHRVSSSFATKSPLPLPPPGTCRQKEVSLEASKRSCRPILAHIKAFEAVFL
eukprot:1158125-Pelagomonas_calceolata.AAC.1